MLELEEALEGCAIKDLKGIDLSDQKVIINRMWQRD